MMLVETDSGFISVNQEFRVWSDQIKFIVFYTKGRTLRNIYVARGIRRRYLNTQAMRRFESP
jgi:hypothetical protein